MIQGKMTAPELKPPLPQAPGRQEKDMKSQYCLKYLRKSTAGRPTPVQDRGDRHGPLSPPSLLRPKGSIFKSDDLLFLCPFYSLKGKVFFSVLKGRFV